MQSASRRQLGTHAPSSVVGPTPPSGARGVDENSAHALLGLSARHAASPVAPSAQAVRHAAETQRLFAQRGVVGRLHAAPSGEPIASGAMQRRQLRSPPLQRAPKPHTRPAGHTPVVVHSSASGVKAWQRLVLELQKLLPAHA